VLTEEVASAMDGVTESRKKSRTGVLKVQKQQQNRA
jgi:hypothetical protein